MNKHRIEGAAKEAKGKVTEFAGKVTDDETLKAKGNAYQVNAKAQQAWGNVKDAAKQAAENTKNAAQKVKEGVKNE
jgi:uncharacterized protein YjbJ (UPF0337 family)